MTTASLAEQLDARPDLKTALEIAKELGCTIEQIQRTGEVRVVHDKLLKHVTVNGRRTDTPMSLMRALRKLAEGPQSEELADSGNETGASPAAQAVTTTIARPQTQEIEIDESSQITFPPKSWKKWRSGVMHVTPEIAERMLQRNTSNRKLREGKVQRHVQAINNNTWHLTHQGIAFDTDGNLVDGQHRLHAIMRTGKTVQILVTYGLPPETFFAIDQGDRRTTADHYETLYTSIHGERPKYSIHVSGIAFGMLNGLKRSGYKDRPRADDAAEFACERYQLLERLFGNACLYFGEEAVFPLAERLAKGLFRSEIDPMKALYDRLVKAKVKGHTDKTARLRRQDKYGLAVTAIRAALSGDKRYRLIGTSDEIGQAEVDKRIRATLREKGKKG
jgi:hypothetical protein